MGHKHLFFHPIFSSSTNVYKSWIQYMIKYILSISLEYWKVFLSFNSQVGKVLFSDPALTCAHLRPPELTCAHPCPPVPTCAGLCSPVPACAHLACASPGFQFLSQDRVFLCSLADLELASYVDQAGFELTCLYLQSAGKLRSALTPSSKI